MARMSIEYILVLIRSQGMKLQRMRSEKVLPRHLVHPSKSSCLEACCSNMLWHRLSTAEEHCPPEKCSPVPETWGKGPKDNYHTSVAFPVRFHFSKKQWPLSLSSETGHHFITPGLFKTTGSGSSGRSSPLDLMVYWISILLKRKHALIRDTEIRYLFRGDLWLCKTLFSKLKSFFLSSSYNAWTFWSSWGKQETLCAKCNVLSWEDVVICWGQHKY